MASRKHNTLSLDLGGVSFALFKFSIAWITKNISEVPPFSSKLESDLVLHNIVCTAKAPTTLLQNLADRIHRDLVTNLLVDDGIEQGAGCVSSFRSSDEVGVRETRNRSLYLLVTTAVHKRQ
jgi:hypothetical protein